MTLEKTLLALLVAALVSCARRPEPAGTSGGAHPEGGAARFADRDDLDRRVESRMREAKIVGLGAAVIVDRKLVRARGYGYADREAGIPFTPNTVMNVGSISKTFIGAAMMRAAQDGKLALDEDINVHLPFEVRNPHFPDEKITLRHLATHTSGITDRTPVYDSAYHEGGDSPEPLGSFLRAYFASDGKNYSKENFLKAKPGAYREYSNIAAGLAGYVVERATGSPLNEYTKRHFLLPLSMTSTGWFLSEVPRTSHSKLYEVRGGTVTEIPLYGLTTYPDGGVRTSIADLSKFFIALLEGGEYEGVRILDEPSVAEMLRFQYTPSSKPENVDLKEKNSGIFWSTKMDVTFVGHGGSDPGVKAEMLADLSRENGVILLANTSVPDEDMRIFYAAFKDLFQYAQSLERGASRAP